MSAFELEPRFWDKVEPEPMTGCWLWTASLNYAGYGQYRHNHRMGLAHRFAYREAVGPIPEGKALDHLCKTPACVRPDHLEPVTWAENQRREIARRKWCRSGRHRWPDCCGSFGNRCRVCANEQQRRRRHDAQRMERG